MPIVPDDKNWTWVLERSCPECGFRAETVDPLAMSEAIHDVAAVWPELLRHPNVTTRPNDSTWSALEYGCHVRDVFRLYDRRLELMLTEDGPRYRNWDQDVTAIEDRYAEQDPSTVAKELLAAAEQLAARFATVTRNDLDRTGYRSDGVAFTVDSFARYMIHDPLHHVHDVRSGYAALDRT